MRARSRAAALISVAAGISLLLGLAPVDAALAGTSSTVSWTPDLASAEAADVVVTDGTARLNSSVGEPDRIGLLTFPAQHLMAPADRITASINAETPPGSTAVIETRVRRINQAWTEWQLAPHGQPTAPAELSREVQARLVLTGPPGVVPAAREISLTARTVAEVRAAGRSTLPLRYRVFATREGLVGGTTANGHVINDKDHFVALPSRRALARRDSDDYSVKVCVPSGRCVWAPVWDVGPWNTHDDYWNPAGKRESWIELPQGVPQAQAAFLTGFNGGLDGFERPVRNPAGIDLADGLFYDALGLTDNTWVQVTLLWTGSTRLLTVRSEGQPVPVRSAARADAKQVGVAADNASVPVECAAKSADGARPGWLRIGLREFVQAEFVPAPADIQPCA